ncbi:hypothetical protein B0920_13155 [Massilia sp. KIM]|nr:hypothetical protein B0920_13155 [Massilia sp. KIM]
MHLALDAALPMALVWGTQHILLYNAAMARTLGNRHPDAFGRSAEEAWPELLPLARQARDGIPFRAGTLHCSALRDDAGAPAGMCVMRVGGEDRAQERDRNQAHFQSLFTQSVAGIAEAGMDGRIVRANEAYCRILGRSLDETIGRHLRELIHPDDYAANIHQFHTLARRAEPFEIENRYLRKDGSVVWVAKTVAPVVGADGRSVEGVLAVVVDVTRRKAAEEQAREGAQRLRLASEAADLGIWSWDVASDTAQWENDMMYTIFGVPRDGDPTNMARFMAEVIHRDDEAAFRQALARTLDSGARLHVEGRFYRRSDGALRWFECTGLLHRDAQGRPLRIVGTSADVTERKESLERLRNAQARLEATLDAGEVGTWLFDLRERKLYSDANMARLHGISDEDAASAAPEVWVGTIHPEDRENVLANVERSIASGAPYQVTYRSLLPDGQCRFFHARGKIEYEDGAPALMPGVVLDITERRDIEERLRTREERYRTLLTAMDEAFCVVELVFDEAGTAVDHRFLETNPAFERHTGLAGAVGKTAREMAPGVEPRWNALYARVAASGVPERLLDHAEPLGRWFDVFVARAQPDARDKVAILFRDVTEQKRVDEELRQLASDLARANQRQNEFLATLAHELRNPLAPIRTGLDLMRLGSGDPASIARLRGMMERQVNHLVHLVNDLLDLARVQSGKVALKKARVALDEIVASAVETAMPLIEEKRHALRVNAAGETLWLEADAHRLAQVIGNLLTNAAKYTPPQGSIALSVKREGEQAVVEVADNGIGIPPEALPGLFQMFNQGRHGMDYAQGGLGIGLNLVKRLTEKHGGTVSVSSPGPNGGSTFSLRLPLAAARGEGGPASAPAAERRGEEQRENLRILVADDNQDAAELLAQMLEMEGHTVRTAQDGLSALAAARAFRPDLALLDIGMPGMDGYQVARAIREEAGLACTVLAAVTGWGAKDDRQRSREAGFDHHLTKPVDLDSLAKLVATVKPATVA